MKPLAVMAGGTPPDPDVELVVSTATCHLGTLARCLAGLFQSGMSEPGRRQIHYQLQ